MFRERLAPHEGMFFIFERDTRHGIWMKNMKFPIDILWIDRNKIIVGIKKNAPACGAPCPTYSAYHSAQYVLEVNAGFVDTNQIKVGDPVEFSLP